MFLIGVRHHIISGYPVSPKRNSLGGNDSIVLINDLKGITLGENSDKALSALTALLVIAFW